MALLLLCFVLVSTMAQVIKGGGELVVRVEAVENKFANPYTMLAAMAMLGVGYAVGRLWNARCYWKKEERYKMKIELLRETVADLEKAARGEVPVVRDLAYRGTKKNNIPYEAELPRP